jgi:hypothetical protein
MLVRLSWLGEVHIFGLVKDPCLPLSDTIFQLKGQLSGCNLASVYSAANSRSHYKWG